MATANTRIVNASGLHVRSAAALDASIIGTLGRGSAVRLMAMVGNGDVWSLVEFGGRTGWVCSKYLSLADHPAGPLPNSEEYPWMPIAIGELGVLETIGSGNTARVLEYLRSTELDRALASDDATPWCSAFVNWCVEKAGLVGTNSAAARSWLGWGRGITVPRRGCITVFSRESSDHPNGGHVAFFVSQTATVVSVLGGNQHDRVCVAEYSTMRVLGYRAPHYRSPSR